MDRDLTGLTLSQLTSIYNSLGNSASEFKDAIIGELVGRLLSEYPGGFSPWYCGPSEVYARKHATWLPVYEIVKDSADYQKRVSDLWSDRLRRSSRRAP